MSIAYCRGYKYQLQKSYSIQLHYTSPETGIAVALTPTSNISTNFITLTTGGLLTIASGYAWDGPSGWTFDTSNFMRASLIHDVLYELIREEWLPRTARYAADLELKRICLEDGMSRLRAWWVFVVVNKFADKYVLPSSNKFIYFAP